MRWFWLVLGMVLSAAQAQPRISVTGGAERSIEFRSVAVEVDIAGRLAQTRISYELFNPNARVLEGEFALTLLDGQRIAGFALDIDGELRDAVPVEKARGQAVFEEVIRTRVDPALLEKTAGNQFKLRVYPLPAQGSRRVVVRIAETLKAGYRLPLDFGAPIGAFSLKLAAGGKIAPTAMLAGKALKFTRKQVWRAEASEKNYSARGALTLNVPAETTPIVYTETHDGKTYFAVEVPISDKPAARPLPKIVGLLWDSSGSAAGRDQAREFELLTRYFARIGTATVRLTRLRDVTEAVQVFRVLDGNWDELKRALETTPYDGASALGAFKPEAQVEEYLLFSDGLNNWGTQPFPTTSVPLHAVLSAAAADATWLRFVAERSGGQLLDITQREPKAALAALIEPGVQLRELRGDGVRDLVASSTTVENGSVLIAGELTAASGELRLQTNSVNGRASIVRVPLTAFTPSALIASQWASLRIAQLDGEYTLHRAEIRRLGQRFGLVTRETSLIVLDAVADYVRFAITPPPSLRAAFDALQAQNLATQRTDQRAHLDGVVASFNDKVSWWERDFPKTLARKDTDKIARQNDDRQTMAEATVTGSRVQSAPSPMAPAPAMAMAGAAAEREAPVALDAVSDERKRDSGTTGSSATITLKKFLPDSPEMQRLRATPSETLYQVYLDERPNFTSSTAFFMDAADLFIERGQPALGLRVLSNLAEMSLENRAIARVLGYRLLQAKAYPLAINVFRQVLALSPDEPQSYRDLGLALAANGEQKAAAEMLWQVVQRPWHNRFPGVELIALGELNALAARAKPALTLDFVDPRLRRNLPLGLRAVLSWDADNTDIDLWVTDPNGEKAYYGNPLTQQGGRMSADFTGGYGPEEFALKTPLKGKYVVEAQYYGDRRQNLAGVTTLQLALSTAFGTSKQQDQSVTLRLQDAKDTVYVGEFEVR